MAEDNVLGIITTYRLCTIAIHFLEWLLHHAHIGSYYPKPRYMKNGLTGGNRYSLPSIDSNGSVVASC
jgi:hypothetical protein